MSSAIGTTLPFERLSTPLFGTLHDSFGEVTIIADSTTWWISAIQIFEDGFSFWLRPRTVLFDKVRLAIHRQCGDDISERLNSFVEDRGGYEILFGQAIPANRLRCGSNRYLPANDDNLIRIDVA